MNPDPRPFVENDAPRVAALTTRLRPDSPTGSTELLSLDRDQQELGYGHARLVAEQGGELLGFAAYSQSPGQYHPRKFGLQLMVAPEFQGRGIGKALFDALLAKLDGLNPLALRSLLSEADDRALRFAAERGFVEDRRYWASSLDVASFDFAPYAGLEDRLAGQGIHLLSAADLTARDPDGWRARLHALFSQVRLDVPRSDPPTPITLAQFSQWVLDDPGFIPEAYVLAEAGGQLIGSSDLCRSEASADLMTGLTGVLPAWRGRGVALALKLRAVRYASAQGVAQILTDNESGNAPMLAVNDRLGFVRRPALISVVRTWAR